MDQPIFYFDFLSPYSFLMWEILKEKNLIKTFEYKPLILGKIFKKVGQTNIADIKPKRDYLFKKALRIAAQNNIKLLAPLQHPFNSLYSLRMATKHACGNEQLHFEVIDCLWKTLWQNRIDAGDPDKLMEALIKSGLPAKQLYEKAFEKEAKSEISQNIDEALESGLFGVPSIFDQNELFWGIESLEDYINYKKGRDPLDINLFREIKATIDRE